MPATMFGTWMRQRRQELELTQEELEARSGIPQSYLSQIERGAVGRPLRDKLKALSAALDVPLWQLAALVYDVRLDAVEQVSDYTDVPIIGTVPSDRITYQVAGVSAVRVLPEMVQGAADPFALLVEAEGFPPAGIVPGDAVILDRPGDGRIPRHRQLVAVRLAGQIVLRRWIQTDAGAALQDADGRIVAQADGRAGWELIGLYVYHRPIDVTDR